MYNPTTHHTQAIYQLQPLVEIYNICQDLLRPQINAYHLAYRLNQSYYPFMLSLNDEWQYCDMIDWFIKCSRAVVGDLYINEVIWNKNLVLELICLYQKHYHQANFYRKFYYQEKANAHELQDYVIQLTNHYARLLFVRVDLKYANNTSVSPTDFDEHTTQLRKLICNKKSTFRDLQGYAWALEQGENGGYHCHLLLIFDGNNRNKAWYIAKMVGEKWQEITKNIGVYFNCHDANYLKKFENQGRLGIGMIHRDNPQEVNNAIRTASYLTQEDKYEQRLKVKTRGAKTFGHGQFQTKYRRGI